jgi:glycerol-3-phosphate O-acyltransferase
MPDNILMPFWLVAVLALAALLSIYRHIIGPLLRLFVTSREKAITERVSQALSRKIPDILSIRRRTRIEMFVNNEEVLRAIDQAVHEGQGTKEVLQHRVREFAEELTPGFYALFYFKIGYYLARFCIRMMYDVKIAKPPTDAMAAIPEDASVVLVGNHRSNVDVMLQAYLASRTSMVSFAAGEWAKAWPMSTLLRMSGSYIIRRNEPLPLYRKILAIHLRDLVRVKMPQGVFLEGELTRDGKIQTVKLGLLSYILSAIGDDNTEDIVFIPIAVNYDQVPEDRALVKTKGGDFQGRSKLYVVGSTLWSLARVATFRIRFGKSAFGTAAISFGEPLSMNDWLQKQKLVAKSLSAEQKKSIVAPVADSLIGEIRSIIPVLPVSLVATVFAANQQPLTRLQIAEGTADLVRRFKASGAILAFTEADNMDPVSNGIDVLLNRHIVIEESGKFKINERNKLMLQYICNTTDHLGRPPNEVKR